MPIGLAPAAGEEHDNQRADQTPLCLKPGTTLLADRGYDAV